MDSSHIECPNCSHTILIKEEEEAICLPRAVCEICCCSYVVDEESGPACRVCSLYHNGSLTRRFRGKNPLRYCIYMIFSSYHQDLRLEYIEKRVKKDPRFEIEVIFLKKFMAQCRAELNESQEELVSILESLPNFKKYVRREDGFDLMDFLRFFENTAEERATQYRRSQYKRLQTQIERN